MFAWALDDPAGREMGGTSSTTAFALVFSGFHGAKLSAAPDQPSPHVSINTTFWQLADGGGGKNGEPGGVEGLMGGGIGGGADGGGTFGGGGGGSDQHVCTPKAASR